MALGHRRIGIVTVGMAGPYGVQTGDTSAESSIPESYVTVQRMKGWLEVLHDAAIDPVVVKYPKMPYRPETDGYDAIKVLLDADPEITGVLCFSDRFAQGVLAGAIDLGLTVPGDLSIVGFDDSPIASNSRPALTTVRQDLAVKGHAAAEALIVAAKGGAKGGANSSKATSGVESPGRSDTVKHVIVPTELVVSASTAAPKASERQR